MKFKKILLITICITFFTCNIEPYEGEDSSEIVDDSKKETEEENPTSTNQKRVTESIGYKDGIEIAKQSFEYLDDKLLNIKVFGKLGNDWVLKTTFNFTNDSNKITKTFPEGTTEYVIANDQLSSVNYLEGHDDLDTGYLSTFSNNKLSDYTFFEGSFSTGTWKYKSILVYDNDSKLIALDNQYSNPTDTKFFPESKTTFSYNGDKISGWLEDYSASDDHGVNEKIEHTYNGKTISTTIENTWDASKSTWEIVAEINYTHDSDGYLLTQKYTELALEFTENHLYDYFYFNEDSLDFNEVRYTYETGESNNYILLVPEFLAHKTPNPYIAF